VVVIHKKDQSLIAPEIIAIALKITDCAENNGWKLIADVPK
jgi:hypothetical protein